MRKGIVLSVFLVFLFGRLISQSTYLNKPDKIYNELLSKYVSSQGNVNYKGFIKEKNKLQVYLDYLSHNMPKSNASENVKLAYWINAYNAFTIKLIMDNYPVESITDLHPYFYIPLFNTVWHEEFFQINGEEFSLNRIEHEILRKEFKEPRIHFAINCASKSCPVLRNEIYISSKINAQLLDQTKRFFSDPTKNKISRNNLELSAIFSWFQGDFESKGGFISFINDNTVIPISPNAEISFLPYNWSLNEL